jgi:hypothetical protein
MRDGDPRSLPQLFRDAVRGATNLVRSEIAVARNEVGEKAVQAATGAGLLVAGGVLIIPAGVLLLLAFASWLTEIGIRPSLAQGAAGLLGLVIAGAVAFAGKSKVAPSNLALLRTRDELRRDARAAKSVT